MTIAGICQVLAVAGIGSVGFLLWRNVRYPRDKQRVTTGGHVGKRFFQDVATGSVYRDDGAVFDPWHWQWRVADVPAAERVVHGAVEALGIILRSGPVRRVPVGVIGPREATQEQAATAELLGVRLGRLGLTVMCGGRQGIMAAVARGVREAGGLAVGLLPGSDWREANDDIVLPIATGLGEARNMIIAKSCAALIVVGDSYGTLSEVAYGLHFGKLVLGLEEAPDVQGVQHIENVDDAVTAVAEHLLGEPVCP